MFDTLSVGSGNRQFTNVQLELSNRVFYPQERMKPHREVARINRNLMRYSRQFNDYLRGPTIDINSFKKLCGILYLTLQNQEKEMKAGSTKL